MTFAKSEHEPKVFEAVYPRGGLRFHLQGLSEAETAAYVAHQVGQAGVDRALFTPSALKLLAGQSRGLPHVINHLASAALWDAESEGPTWSVNPTSNAPLAIGGMTDEPWTCVKSIDT